MGQEEKNRQQPAGGERKDRESKVGAGGKEKDERKGQVVEEDRGRRGGVTGIPADMADSSFCLHLSFPVTVPSSCFAG